MSPVKSLFFVLLLFASSLNAFGYDYYLGTGIRKDCFHWSIAAPDGDPDVLSELTWKDVWMWEAKGALTVAPIPFIPISARLKANYGRIFSGENRDSDYKKSGRRKEFFRSLSRSDKGEAFDLSAALGYRLSLLCGWFVINPMVGWSHQELHLRIHDGKQVLNKEYKIIGLNSNYRAKWRGPWTGFDATLALLPSWVVKTTFEYHWAHFRGTGHWNLSRDFIKDFKQQAFGRGTFFTLGTAYNFRCIELGLEYNFEQIQSHNGLDWAYTFYGNKNSRLNEANWQSMSLLGTATFIF